VGGAHVLTDGRCISPRLTEPNSPTPSGRGNVNYVGQPLPLSTLGLAALLTSWMLMKRPTTRSPRRIAVVFGVKEFYRRLDGEAPV